MQEDGEGCGPLHHAAREGHVQVAGKLLELGAKVQFFYIRGNWTDTFGSFGSFLSHLNPLILDVITIVPQLVRFMVP